MAGKNLALFDFDGTITTKDSLEEFLKFFAGSTQYYKNLFLFLPTYISWKLKIIKNQEAKEKLLYLFIANIEKEEFKKIALEFSLTKIDSIIREEMKEKIINHKKNGDDVLIVSASLRCWIKPWALKLGVEVLSTELRFIDNVYAGHFSTANCYGDEKVKRITKHLDIDSYETIYAYGDSEGDKQMLELANKRYYKGVLLKTPESV